MKKRPLIIMLIAVLSLTMMFFCSACFDNADDGSESTSTPAISETTSDSESVESTESGESIESRESGEASESESTSESETHTHTLTKVESKAATCTEDGNVEYFKCSECGEMFADEAATTVTTLEEVRILKGHKPEFKAAVEATYFEEGTLEHYVCAKCGELFVKQGTEYVKATKEEITVAKKSLITGAATATEPEGVLHIEEKKVKSMTYGGVYTVDGKAAYYFHNETATANGETRFVTEGTDTTVKVNGSYVFAQYNAYKFSFSYKLVNKCENGVADRSTDKYICQILGSDGSYDILTFEPVLDGAWHEYGYVLTEAQTAKFAGFIVKMGGLEGEMLIADIAVEERTFISGAATATEPEGVLHIETEKVKSMNYGGIYAVDGKVAYYFHNNDDRTNAETRFVTEGTNTSLPSAERIYNNYPAYKFSFSYKLINASNDVGVTDGDHWPYIVQILDPTYPILTFEPVADGEWHTAEYTLTAEQTKLFAGFIVKMGKLTGEMLIADIAVEERTFISGAATATEPEGILHIEEKKVKNMTYGGVYIVDGKVAYYFHNETATANGEARFVTEGTDTTVKVNGSYVFAQYNAYKFSFSYKLVNKCENGVADRSTDKYICQILGSDGSYDILTFEPVLDGAWHEYGYVLTEAQTAKFAGFIVKMGGLEGEMLIADVAVEERTLTHTHNNLTKTEAVAATYYQEGRAEYYTCECGKIFADENATTETTAEALTIAKKKIADETTASVADTESADLINKTVADKVKQMDQSAPNFVKILNKDGVEVNALYFSKKDAWEGNTADGSNNYSYSEFRIPVSGHITSISFEYRLVDFNSELCSCTGLPEGDKNLGMKSFLEYKHDNTYTNETKESFGTSCFVADGEWHEFTFDHEMDNMQNILFKIHHFQGEFVVTNIVITYAA